MHTIASQIIASFKVLHDPANSKAMQAYLKDNFICYGIKAVPRREQTKPHNNAFKLLDVKLQRQIIDDLWAQPQRECHMAALDLAALIVKKMDLSWLDYWQEKLTTNAWWDSVDFIAPSIIGPIVLPHIDLQKKYAYAWIESEYLWYQRAAIIYQLKYKIKTDRNILSDMILARSDSKEFFIRKGAGWALREYGNTDPVWVADFVNAHKDVLSPLTCKEATRKLW